MKVVISFLFFSFYSQAQVLIHPDIEIDEFDWSAFNDFENVQQYINTREGYFNEYGIFFSSDFLYWDKRDLINLQKELYKERTREKLTPEEITQAQDTIQFHLEKIKEKEDEIRVFVGFVPEGVPDPYSKDYSGVWGLYKNEYKIIFDFVEKTDEGFYEALGRDDEAYAGFILPYVRDYIERSQIIADTLTNVLDKAYENPETYYKGRYVSGLYGMFFRSREIYKCFLKNFKSPEGENQVVLGELITNWYEDQSLKGLRALMGEYELLNTDPSLSGLPNSTVLSLLDYAHKDSPEKVKEELEVFFRRALTDDRLEKGSFRQKSIFLNSLIGLKNLGLLNENEEGAFRRAEELGGIRTSPENPDFYWSLPTIDLQ